MNYGVRFTSCCFATLRSLEEDKRPDGQERRKLKGNFMTGGPYLIMKIVVLHN